MFVCMCVCVCVCVYAERERKRASERKSEIDLKHIIVVGVGNDLLFLGVEKRMEPRPVRLHTASACGAHMLVGLFSASRSSRD